MNYTPEQTQEAIRQNPQVARDMKLSVNEMKAYTLPIEFTTDEVSRAMRVTQHAAGCLLRQLERKGYLVRLNPNHNPVVYSRVIYSGETK